MYCNYKLLGSKLNLKKGSRGGELAESETRIPKSDADCLTLFGQKFAVSHVYETLIHPSKMICKILNSISVWSGSQCGVVYLL
uniref:Uncharacterized protein n=1 Tax=Arundo donax TaxID=35708 RepID=A0A0A9DBT3_ARUDO